MKKICKKCNEKKPLNLFYKRNLSIYGVSSICKKCEEFARILRKRTKEGLIKSIYYGQRCSSKTRGHDLPPYTLSELIKWALNQNNFHFLFDKWALSNYNKWLTPSFDRVNDYKGYSLDELTIVTWFENNSRSHNDMKGGINNMQSKSVVQMTLDGRYIKEHYSLSQAGRSESIFASSIGTCCKGMRATAGGYRWMYSLNIPIINNRVA